jgi:hypothetical protein
MDKIKFWIKNTLLSKRTSSTGPGSGPVSEVTKRMAKVRFFCG